MSKKVFFISTIILLYTLLATAETNYQQLSLSNQSTPQIKLENKNGNIEIKLEIPDDLKDSITIDYFEIYRNNSLIVTTTTNEFIDQLKQNGQYNYKYIIHAKNRSNNTTLTITSPEKTIVIENLATTTTTNNTSTTSTTNISTTNISSNTSSATTSTTTSNNYNTFVTNNIISTTTTGRNTEETENEFSVENITANNLSNINTTTTKITPSQEQKKIPETPRSRLEQPLPKTTATIKEAEIKSRKETKESAKEKVKETKDEINKMSPVKIKLTGQTLTTEGEILGKSKVFIQTAKDIYEIETNQNGEFNIEIPGWQNITINSVYARDSSIYKSNIINLNLTESDQNINIYLEKEKIVLPQPIEKAIATNKEEKIVLDDNTEITIPATAVTTTNIINVDIKPTIEVPPVTNFSFIDKVYDIKLRDQNNNEIKNLDKEIEIKIEYDPQVLKEKNLSEDEILIGYFDEINKIWIPLEKYTLDKKNKVIIGYVQHLTKFAIISFVDRTPPPPPTNINLTLTKDKKVKINWTNPLQDFKHINIYRSSTTNSSTILLFKAITSTEIIDQNVDWGKTYYYLIKSVDYFNNESTNTKPYIITVFSFNRYLKVGNKGEDVRHLQEILIKENLLSEKIKLGYFGLATKNAVIKFQEKYSKDVLEPLSLKKGTGFVGPYTIKKLNQILNSVNE
ncbi:MAG: hypothetical protein KatS3mg097_134 [Candidatus Parcubacteria bacterium]|nr:MAG: hypothetical protein KatS3mg097_134 [Candidatus Parcubacteria bacterium]